MLAPAVLFDASHLFDLCAVAQDWRNVRACTAMGVAAKFVPPGAVGALFPRANHSAVDALGFLGTVRPRSDRSFSLFDLKGMGMRVRVHSKTWTDLAHAEVMNSTSTFLSLSQAYRSKRNVRDVGLDAFRIAHLLGHRALVIAHHTGPLEEREYAGMMSFVRFEDIPAEWERIRAMNSPERERLAIERFERFQERMSARSLFERAGIYEKSLARPAGRGT